MKILRLFLLLALASPAWAATWFATSSSVNINAVGLWVPTSTGSCTGSGTPLVFGLQAAGDVFDANGCTALAVNTDPGGVSTEVTLQTNATNGGGFTCATATGPSVIHANITATKTIALVITGTSGADCNISGNVQGGSTSSAEAVQGNYSSGASPITLTGNIVGGSATNAYGWLVSNSGALTVVGNVTAGTAATGLFGNTAGATQTVTGNCIGSDTGGFIGCQASSTSVLTITGGIINGKAGSATNGNIRFSSTGTNYVVIPQNASYAIANCLTASQIIAGTCTNALILPADPGKANVLSGTNYGPFTGTYTPAGGGSTIACTTW